MSQLTNTNDVIPPEEVKRRIAEYRRICWERRLPAQVVYHDPYRVCPWPNCGLGILGIHFALKEMADPVLLDHWLATWWQGPGLIARCPQCRQYVLFDVEYKKSIPDPSQINAPILPDDWHQRSHLVIRPQTVASDRSEKQDVQSN